MKPNALRFLVTSNFMRTGFDLHIGQSKENGEFAVVQPLTMMVTNEGSITSPAVTLSQSEAQCLMDELWRAGVRASEAAGSAGQAAATSKHLEDMRTLAFHALNVPK